MPPYVSASAVRPRIRQALPRLLSYAFAPIVLVDPGVGPDVELEWLLTRSVPNVLNRTGVLSSVAFPAGDEMYPKPAMPRVIMFTDTYVHAGTRVRVVIKVLGGKHFVI